MAGPLRELLDSAVAQVQPRAVDPVADVVRRHRTRRRRVVAAAAAALAVLAVISVTAVLRRPATESRHASPGSSASPSEPSAAVTNEPAPPRVPVTGGPATPRVVGGEIVAGGLVLPVPAGWQTTDDDSTIYCDVPPRTVAVGFDPVPGGTGPYCHLKPFIDVTGAIRRDFRDESPRQVTLPGGQPAWVSFGVPDSALGQQPGYNVVGLYVPWSGVAVGITLQQDDFARIVPTIRTQPVAPSALVLPTDVSRVEIVPPDRGSGFPPPRVTDPAVTDQVVGRLLGLTEIVPNDNACATADMPTAAVVLGTSGTSGTSATVVFTLSNHCSQATSSLGGRVQVPAGFVDDLWHLLGGQGALEPTR